MDTKGWRGSFSGLWCSIALCEQVSISYILYPKDSLKVWSKGLVPLVAMRYEASI